LTIEAIDKQGSCHWMISRPEQSLEYYRLLLGLYSFNRSLRLKNADATDCRSCCQ